MMITSEELDLLKAQECGPYATVDYLVADPPPSEAAASSSSPLSCSMATVSTNDNGTFTTRQEDMHCPRAAPYGEMRVTDSRKRKAGYDNCNSDQSMTTPQKLFPNDEGGVRRIRTRVWREMICDWSYQVIDHFDLSREVVCISMNLFDRYCAIASRKPLSKHNMLDENSFKATAIVCLFIAIKLQEDSRFFNEDVETPSLRTLAELQVGTDALSVQQLAAKEMHILIALDWRVHPPTPHTFVFYLCSGLGLEGMSSSSNSNLNEVRDLATYYIELAVLDFFFVHFRPSEIALASLLNAMDHQMYRSMLTSGFFTILGRLRLQQTPRTHRCQERLVKLYEQSSVSPSSPMISDTSPSMESPTSVILDQMKF